MKKVSLKRVVRLIAKIALTVMVILLVSAILLWLFFPKEQVGNRITKELSKKLNQDITMGEFSVGFYPGVSFVGRNMRMVNPATSKEILLTPRVRFDLSVKDLMRGVLVIKDISVSSPKLKLIRDTNGVWNVGGIVKGLGSGEKKKGSSEKKSWLQFGTIRVDDGTITIHDALKDQQLSVNDLGATVDVVRKKATIQTTTLLLGESRYRVKADVTGFSSPSIVGKLSADILNIDEIVRFIAGLMTGSEPSGSSPSSGKKGFSAEVAIEADQMRFGNFTADAVSTVWKASGSKQAFSPLHLELFGGELKGVFDLTMEENGTGWHIDFTGKEMDLALFFDQLLEGGTIKDEAKGLVSAKVTLRGVASPDEEKMLRSLNGEFTFETAEGTIKNSHLLNTIVIAMQLPASILFHPGVSLVDRLGETAKKQGRNLVDMRVLFNSITGTFHIDDGVAHTKDFHFEGKTFQLLATGEIDLAEKQLYMKTKVTNIGPVSLVLSKVPFIGNELEKARKTVFLINFNVDGPLADPELHLYPWHKHKPKEKK